VHYDCHFCLASGDRGRDSSAKEFVSSIFHAANKRIRRSRDKSSGRMRESGERDGTLSEPTSFSERNIDHELELRQLQELLRTGGTTERVDETDVLASASSHSGSTVSSISSTISAETKDVSGTGGHGSKTVDAPTRREGRGSSSLKERRTLFMQNGCNQPAAESNEQKRRSVNISRLADSVMLQETDDSPMAESFTIPVLPSTSSPGDAITVPSSRAAKMQEAVEQHMQQLADDLQRTFNATAAALSPPNVSPVASRLHTQHEQETTAVHPAGVSASSVATTCAADSQSVTSDYSTMSSIYGGRDGDCRSRLVSGDVEVTSVQGTDTRKISHGATLGHCRNRNDQMLSTPRSQSSGNFSLANSDPVDSSLCTTASAMELSQDSIDSAADHSDQLSLSFSSQMSDSQMSESDVLLQTVSMADKYSFSPAQQSGTEDRKSCDVNRFPVQPAVRDVEQFGKPTGAGLMLHSDTATDSPVGLTVLSPTGTESETDVVLDKPGCSASSEERDACGVQISKHTAEVPCLDRVVTEPVQPAPCEDDTACSRVAPLAGNDDQQISTHSAKEQFLQSQRPFCRLVRRHTLNGTGDLAVCAVDLQSELLRSVQFVPSHDEENVSAWQRLRPAVKDRLPNFRVWLATQQQHAHSSPALFAGAGVALTSTSHLPSSQLFV